MAARPFQVTLKGFNQSKTIDYTKVSFTMVKTLKWDTSFETIDDDCAYACALHFVQLK